MKNPRSSVILAFWTKNSAIKRQLDARLGAIHGIGFSEFMVLFYLNQSPNLLMKRIDLANALGMSASAVTKMFNPMEKIGLVSKEANPRDARVSLVKLTASGLKTYQRANVSLDQLADSLFHRLDDAEIQQLLKIMAKLDV